jgi:elongation factor P
MAFTESIVKGMIIKYDGDPYLIVEREFYKPGKGNSFNRCKMRNLKNGKIINVTYKSGEKVEQLDIQTKNQTFSYNDDSNAYFMDPTTFEQITIPLEIVPGGKNFLMGGENYIVMIYEDEVISVQLPPKMTLTVTETAGAEKGNTASNATKEATLETGFRVQVPLFVKNGDKIVINTDSGTYVSKG